MKRRAVQIVLLLLLGAIVNVAVAWAYALPNSRSAKYSNATALQAHDQHLRLSSFGLTPSFSDINYQFVIRAQTATVFGNTTTRFLRNELDSRAPLPGIRVSAFNSTEALEVWSGWPVPSMTGARGRKVPQPGTTTNWEYWYAIPFPVDWEQSVFPQDSWVPLRPIWPGFAINTIFYAAILGLLFFAPGSVRRAFRRRRGLCPACAYPVGTSPVCTECGKAVEPSAVSPRRSALIASNEEYQHPKDYACDRQENHQTNKPVTCYEE